MKYLRGTITKFSHQRPMVDHHEKLKVENISGAFVGLEQVQRSITQCATTTPPWNFIELYAALDSAGLQKQKESDGKERTKAKINLTPRWPEFYGIYKAFTELRKSTDPDHLLIEEFQQQI